MSEDVLKLKRGTSAKVAAYLPALGEPLYNYTTGALTIGDGVTLGGVSLANVLSALKLATARNIALTGPVTGTVAFDGSANVSLATSISLATAVPIGSTTPSTGAFTTLSSTGAFTPSQTAGIVGTTAVNNANAGSVGEYLSNIASGVAITNGTNTNVVTLALTPGDWDVGGGLEVAYTGTNTAFYGWLTLTSAGSSVQGNRFVVANTTGSGSNAIGGSVPTLRVNVSVNTTVYLVAFGSFSTGTGTVGSKIWARRVR